MKLRQSFSPNIFYAVLSGIPALLPAISVAEPKSDRPNIIFVLVDDLRWDAMGFTGQYPFLKTPHIDQLRKEGVHFQNAFCTHSLCAPSRATILTGMFPQTNGVSTNQEGREFNPDKTPSFAQILQGEGYKTAFIGKWHMAESMEPRKGFDYWCSFSGQGNYNGNDLNINGKVIRNDGYITDELNKYALNFVDKSADKPFCLYLSHKAVHQPFTPAERDKDLYSTDLVPEPAGWRDNMENKPAWQRIEPNLNQRLRLRDKDLNKITPVKSRQFGPWPTKTGKGEQKNYLRCLSAVDDGLGEIYELLKEKGILDNTMIVFAGDNGFFHGEHGKGDKRLAYNESMRIPLVMRYPKMARAGKTVLEMVLNADLAPTFLEVAGVPIPAQMQGKSVVPLLKGKVEGWRKSFLFTYWPDLIYSIPRIAAIRTERYLYSTTPDLKDIDELYDEQNDPAELNNLAENLNFSELKRELSKQLEQLKKETGYRDEVPRPDTEPVINLKTGKLFSIEFGKISFDNQSGDEIRFSGVKKAVDRGEICGNFLEGASAEIANNPDLDPSLGTFVIECVIKSNSPDGVIASCGSQKDGWTLYLENGLPGFVVAHNQHLQFVDGVASITGKWSHLVAVIENYNNIIKLFADGKLIGQRQMLLPIQTVSGKAANISIGVDSDELVDPKEVSKYKFDGLIKQISFIRGKVNNILTDTGFENGMYGELYSNNSDWEVQRTGRDTSEFIVNRIESCDSAFCGKKYCFMSLPKSADASKFEHITIGQRSKLDAGKIYEASIWVKWVNTKNGNSTAIVSFWAQHMEDKTFAGKDCWLKNGEWTKLSFRFMAVKPNEPTFIYVSLLPHQTPQTTEILVDEFNCEIVETVSNMISRKGTMVLNENFENDIVGTIPSKPWELTNPNKLVTGIIEQNNGNKFVTIKIPPKTDNYTAVKLMQKINLSKGALYDVDMSLKWNNFSPGNNSGIVNWGIYHSASNTWYGPIDQIVANSEWHNVPFVHGATYDGEYQLYIQVFGWGNFGQPMDVSCDNFNVKMHN